MCVHSGGGVALKAPSRTKISPHSSLHRPEAVLSMMCTSDCAANAAYIIKGGTILGLPSSLGVID